MDGSLKNGLKASEKPFILFCGAFSGTSHPVSGGAVLTGFVTHQQQRIDVVAGIFPAILMEYPAAPGKAHGGKSVILGDYNVSRIRFADEGIVHTVGAFVEDQSCGTFPMEFMSGVTQKQTGDPVFLTQPYGKIRNRTAIRINEYLHCAHLPNLC